MRQFANILVFVILYLQCINSENVFKQKTIYAYKGKILMKNAASDKLASIWTISGKLSVENVTDHVTFKLDDVKTRMFNGDPELLNLVHEKNIPGDSEIIQEPFVVYPGNKSGYHITHKPNEPIWSLNMKRSIASIFFLNTDKKTNSVVDETTIYGDCDVTYEISNNEGITIWKTIDRSYCRNSPNLDTNNFHAKFSEPINSETERIYHFDDAESLRKVESISLTTHQSMPGVRSKQIIEESQEFTRISNTTVFNALNIAELTETSSVIVELSTEIDTKKKTEKKNSDELVKYFTENYEEFKEFLKKSPLLNINVDVNDTISNMYDALDEMDKDTLLRLEKKILKIDDNLLQHMFVSYLPYLGSNDSLYYMKDLVVQDKVFNDLLLIKILATLPRYINDISQEIVEDMEDLMNLKKVNNQVKYAGILCFASIVSTAKVYEVLSPDRVTKYVGIYSKNFEDAQNHETKMVWLLGLINMANAIKNEEFFAIISNVQESRQIRVLAAFGLKEYFADKTSSEAFANVWPIIKNNSEPLEVRVACFNLIFGFQLTIDQLENIVNWYKDELLEQPTEQHLVNYLYTSLKVLNNSTGFFSYLGDDATEILQQIKPPKLNKVWSTGNYRMAYSDNEVNFGASFLAKLISDPVTNVLNTAFLSVGNVVHSMHLGRYSAYIKAEGIADVLFSHFVFDHDEDEFTVPKLLELMQKNAYRFKQSENVHVDIVLFCQNRVVFSLHINKHNIDNYSTNPIFIEFLSLIKDYNSLSFPLFDYNYRVSDLGTALTFYTDIIEVASYELPGLNKMYLKISNDSSLSSEDENLLKSSANYRSTLHYSLSANSYNPLIDASIATFKYIGEEKRIHIPYAFNYTSMLLQLKHKKDAFNLVGDHLIGTQVDKKEVLREYCENCHHVSLVNNDDWNNYLEKKNIFWDVIGVTLNVTETKLSAEQIALNSMEPKRTDSLLDVINDHYTIISENIGKPFLLLHHYILYNRYINNDLYRYSIRSIPFYNEDPTETTFKLFFRPIDNSNDKNPITKSDMNLSIALTTRKQRDAEILSHGKLTFRYFSTSESNSSDVQPEIHHKYKVELVMFSDTKTPIKICVDRDVQYPSRRTNKFSLDAVDSAKAITTLLYGSVDNITSECPTKDQYYVVEIYSASDEQRAILLASNEYKNCKEQSKGLKYTPPTDDCFRAHEIISKYEICDIYADTIPQQNDSSIPRTSEYGVHLIQYAQLNETHAKLSLINEQQLEKLIDLPNELYKAIITPDIQPLMTINPRVVAYNDDNLEWGTSSACYITPNRIRTFTGHTIKTYDEKSVGDAVAFVECINRTTTGMTIQKYGDKYVGFHLYSYNDTLVVSVPNEDGKLKIEFNNKIVTKTNKSDIIKRGLYYLDDDVIYVTIDVADIYITAEYISLKINSIYNNYICGLCAETRHN